MTAAFFRGCDLGLRYGAEMAARDACHGLGVNRMKASCGEVPLSSGLVTAPGSPASCLDVDLVRHCASANTH